MKEAKAEILKVSLSTKDIEKLTGKKHNHIMRDVSDKLLPKIDESKSGRIFYLIESATYKDAYKRDKPMYILNKHAVNVFMANYSMEHAMVLVERLDELESENVKLEEQLSIMKNIVWKVINNKSFISREYALKSAGINHPRLFMKYLSSNESFYSSVLKREFLKDQHVSPSTKVLMFTQDGFQWLLGNTEKINSWVEDNKKLQRCIL